MRSLVSSTFALVRATAGGVRMLAVLYGLGVLLCGYLFSLSVGSWVNGFCELFGSDCLSVSGSEYGTVGIFPVAGFGVAYFLFQLGILACRWPGDCAGRSLLATTNILAAGVSLYFIYVMAVLLKQSCIVCYGVHGINFISLAVVLRQGGRERSAGSLKGGREVERPFRLGQQVVAPLLLALTVFSALNLWASHTELVDERKKLGQNLEYFHYVYRNSPLHSLPVSEDDQVIGDPELAIHQIVLVYKEGCRHCRATREKLTATVQAHLDGVYLVLKNFQSFSAEELDRFGISRVPAVFINGKRAEGWDAPGFLDEFTAGCGC